MKVKRILILLPLVLVLFLAQSFFWVPTYEKQAVGNPDRLLKYISASGGDAQILNPVLSADTASSEIEGLVFDGLMDLDEDLEFRLRLASKWSQYEEAYLVLDLETLRTARPENQSLTDTEAVLRHIRGALQDNADWTENVKSIEVLPETTREEQVDVPMLDAAGAPVKENGRPKMETLNYRLELPPRLKFTLEKIDQDFFKPIEKLLGEGYFKSFPREKYIRARDAKQQKRLAPQLEDLLSVAEHNPVIVFELRQDVRFHDGHAFDAQDVLFTYRSIMNPKNASPRTSSYEPIKSVDVQGPHQVRIVYKRLFSPALYSWSMGILPEHLLNAEKLQEEARARGMDPETFTLRDSNFNRNPVGTGPFVFKEWKSDEMIRLVRNEDYWEGPPEYHEYMMRIIPDVLTGEMEFYAGAVDNYGVMPHQVDRLRDDPKYQSFSTVGMTYSYIGYNLRNPLFQSRKVREALGMAINVDAIIEYILYGEGERVTGPYAKITDWYDHSVKPIPYDPEGALKLLNEEGWKKNADGWLEKDGKPFQFNLITNSGNPIRKNILTIVQDAWKKIGVKCNTQFFEWAVFLKDFVNTLKFDALVLGWSTGIDPDMFQLWHSSQTGPNKLNFVGYENPEVDRLIVRIRREYERSEQVQMTRKLHRIIARDQPYTFLYVAKATRLLDKKIVIVEKQPDGSEKYVKIYPIKSGDIRFYFNKWRKLGHVPQFSQRG